VRFRCAELHRGVFGRLRRPAGASLSQRPAERRLPGWSEPRPPSFWFGSGGARTTAPAHLRQPNPDS
jgi:hypothetical protein